MQITPNPLSLLSDADDGISAVPRDPLSHLNLNKPRTHLLHRTIRLRFAFIVKHCRWNIHHRLADSESKDPLEKFRGLCIAAFGGTTLEHCYVAPEHVKPIGAGESVDDGEGTQVNHTRRYCWLLGGDDYACAVVSLQPNHGQERLGQNLGGRCICHVLEQF
jgi:hypothetical protein